MSDNINKAANYCIGTVAGYATYKFMPKLITTPAKDLYINRIRKVSAKDNQYYWEKANEAHKKSILYEPADLSKIKPSRKPKIDTTHKAEILDINPDNMEKIKQEISDRRPPAIASKKQSILSKILFGDRKKTAARKIKVTAEGKNAFCMPYLTKVSSLVVVNKDKYAFSTFHEDGHALNVHSKGFKKFLSRSRGLFALSIPFLTLYALLSPKKKSKTTDNNTNEEKGFRNFVKKHCGVLAASLMLPTVMEEGMASINGAKLAKSVNMDQAMYKKLNRLNTKAWLTYVVGTIALGLSVQLGVNLKEKLVEDQLIKLG